MKLRINLTTKSCEVEETNENGLSVARDGDVVTLALPNLKATEILQETAFARKDTSGQLHLAVNNTGVDLTKVLANVVDDANKVNIVNEQFGFVIFHCLFHAKFLDGISCGGIRGFGAGCAAYTYDSSLRLVTEIGVNNFANPSVAAHFAALTPAPVSSAPGAHFKPVKINDTDSTTPMRQVSPSKL